MFLYQNVIYSGFQSVRYIIIKSYSFNFCISNNLYFKFLALKMYDYNITRVFGLNETHHILNLQVERVK